MMGNPLFLLMEGWHAPTSVRPVLVNLLSGSSSASPRPTPAPGGLVPPLFLHTPPGPSDARLGEAGAEAEWELRIRELFRHQVTGVFDTDGGPCLSTRATCMQGG